MIGATPLRAEAIGRRQLYVALVMIATGGSDQT